MVADAHALGLRVFVDVVPNHFSWEHRWFRQALETAPGSPEWARFHAVRGRGENGELPPNNWPSAFGGPAWTPVPGHDGWWYLHLFDSSQPDVNWENPEIHEDFAATLRFWFDMGVDGFRIDVAHSLIKEAGYPDGPEPEDLTPWRATSRARAWDQPRVHDVWREWRRLAEHLRPAARVRRRGVGRDHGGAGGVHPPRRAAHHVQLPLPQGLLGRGGHPRRHRHVAAHLGRRRRPATWVLSNHDVWRPVTRFAPWLDATTIDLEAGRRRALAMSLLSLALPGSAYLYQGEELGLPEVLDLPDEARQDPTFFRTEGAIKGRDGCRVPIPWSGDAPPYGFSTGTPWLPQPADWAGLTAQAQERRRALDPRALQARAARAQGEPGARRRRAGVARVRARRRAGHRAPWWRPCWCCSTRATATARSRWTARCW